jgi:hypothetical protein
VGSKLSYSHQWSLKLKQSGKYYFRLATAAKGQHNMKRKKKMTPEIRVKEWELTKILKVPVL